MTLDRAADSQDDYGDATPDDLIATIDECSKEARDKRDVWKKEAETCYAFVASDQWDEADLKILEDGKRPAVTIPLVGPVIDVVSGLEVTNRQEVQYLPRELGDAGANEVLTGAGQWVRDECNAEDEESESFLDMAICGEGWTETRLDYEYDADGTILTERVDPLEMLPDASSKKKNYKDANYLIREKMVSVLWLKETWPEKAEEIDATSELSESDKEFSGEAHRNVTGDQYQAPSNALGQRAKAKRELKLVEYQYKKREPFYRIQLPSGEMLEASPEEYKAIQERAQGVPLKAVKQLKCIHYRAFKVGQVLLENEQCPDPGSYTYKAMTAKRDRKKGCWYGIVRPMLDPQRWVNKFFSQSMHILNTNAKGGVAIERDAVPDMAAFEASWAKSDKVTVVNPGTLAAGKIQPKVPPPFPTELAKLLEFCVAMVYKVSGISPEMLGSVDREQAAVLEYQRKQAGVTILATLFDALRKYRKEQGKNALYLILTYLSDGRLVRIVGQQGAKYVQLIRQEGVAKYDVIIDESPSSPNQKEKTWVILQSLLPILIKAGVQLPPQVFDYLPLPQSLLDAIKKPDPAKQQQQQMQQQLQMRGAVAEVSKTEAEAELARAKAQAEGQGDQGQMQAEMMKVAQQGQLKREELTLEAQLAERQMQMENALDMQAAKFKASLDAWIAEREIDLKERVAASDARIAEKKAAQTPRAAA